MGGLIIGTGFINFLLRNNIDNSTINTVLLANIATYVLGLFADVWGMSDGALTAVKIVPVEITHLFVGIGSLIYFLQLKETK
jgi:uncharacterized membrane protein